MINNQRLRDLRKQGIFNNNDYYEYAKPSNSITRIGFIWAVMAFLGVVIGIMVVCQGCAYSQTIQGIDVDRLANAIYIAEGGSLTNHPYGILAKYKHTTPRQACINTIKHKLRDFNREIITQLDEREFIAYLGQTYCPVGASNDPGGLNLNWVGNVIELYEKL